MPQRSFLLHTSSQGGQLPSQQRRLHTEAQRSTRLSAAHGADHSMPHARLDQTNQGTQKLKATDTLKAGMNPFSDGREPQGAHGLLTNGCPTHLQGCLSQERMLLHLLSQRTSAEHSTYAGEQHATCQESATRPPKQLSFSNAALAGHIRSMLLDRTSNTNARTTAAPLPCSSEPTCLEVRPHLHGLLTSSRHTWHQKTRREQGRRNRRMFAGAL